MAFISEIHYRNSTANATGVDEYVEVTLSPAEFSRAGDFQIATYEQNGQLSDSVTLSDLTPVLDATTGFYVYTFETITTDPDGANGNAEAIALVDNSLPDPVLSFFDIGGGTSSITAAAGTPAAGATSTNIPATSEESIQFDAGGEPNRWRPHPGQLCCLLRGRNFDRNDKRFLAHRDAESRRSGLYSGCRPASHSLDIFAEDRALGSAGKPEPAPRGLSRQIRAEGFASTPHACSRQDRTTHVQSKRDFGACKRLGRLLRHKDGPKYTRPALLSHSTGLSPHHQR